jgi:hypothetical protein
MITFEIEWTNKQKFLGVLSGILTITDQNTYMNDTDKTYNIYHRVIGKCEVSIKEGSTSFTAIEGEPGIPSILIEFIGGQIQDAMRNYFAGFYMNDKIYCHIDTREKEKTTDWAKRKMRDMPRYLRRVLFNKKSFKEINSMLEKLFDEGRENAAGSNR